jgi:7,8-dihydro-6-hydroxymethylpterin-pyrophosphokinase
LLYGERELDTPELRVPHPRLEQRTFVLAPLCEVWPERRLPSGRSVSERLAELSTAARA